MGVCTFNPKEKICQVFSFILQSSSDMLQSQNLLKVRGATRPDMSLSVALLQILRLGHVRAVLQYDAIICKIDAVVKLVIT